jgi:hypothetical protein
MIRLDPRGGGVTNYSVALAYCELWRRARAGERQRPLKAGAHATRPGCHGLPGVTARFVRNCTLSRASAVLGDDT